MKTTKNTNFICPILSVQQWKLKCYNLSLNFSILSEYYVVKCGLIMAGATMINVSLRKDLRHNFFSGFLGFGDYFSSQKRIFRPQGTIQPIFYHSQPIRLKTIFCATNELEYRLTSSVSPGFFYLIW